MGLDSFCIQIEIERVIDDFTFADKKEEKEIMYWRKHHTLHEWMKRLFIRKGGDYSQHQFNCEYIRITLEDLNFLKNDMDWLDEYPFDEADYDDHAFIEIAEKILSKGDKALYFHSWY